MSDALLYSFMALFIVLEQWLNGDISWDKVTGTLLEHPADTVRQDTTQPSELSSGHNKLNATVHRVFYYVYERSLSVKCW